MRWDQCPCTTRIMCLRLALSPVHGAAVLASYEKHFPLKELAPVFTKVEAARKGAEKARGAARKAKHAAEKTGDQTGDAAEARMEDDVPQPGEHC